MRQLQTQEVKSVSGSGLVFSTLKVTAQAGGALLNGLGQAGTIVIKPVVVGTVNTLKFLI